MAARRRFPLFVSLVFAGTAAAADFRHLCVVTVAQLATNAAFAEAMDVDRTVVEYFRLRASVGKAIQNHLATGAHVRFGADWYVNVSTNKIALGRRGRSIGDLMEDVTHEVRRTLAIEKAAKELDTKIWLDRLAFLQARTGIPIERLESDYALTYDAVRRHPDVEKIPFVSGRRSSVRREGSMTIAEARAEIPVILSSVVEDLVETKVVFGKPIPEVVERYFEAVREIGPVFPQAAEEVAFVSFQTGLSVREVIRRSKALLAAGGLTEWFQPNLGDRKMGEYEISNFYSAVNLLRHATTYQNEGDLEALVKDWVSIRETTGLRKGTLFLVTASLTSGRKSSDLLKEARAIRDELRALHRALGDELSEDASGKMDRSPWIVEGDARGKSDLPVALEGIVVGVPPKQPFTGKERLTEGDLLERAIAIVETGVRSGVPPAKVLRIYRTMQEKHRHALYYTGNDTMSALHGFTMLYFPTAPP